MARGGSRIGAGRKPGSRTKRTGEIAEQAAARGITPLEVMLKAMTEHAHAGNLDKAAAIAKDAAPYMHPRMSTIAHTGKCGGPIECTYDFSKLSDNELEHMQKIFEVIVVDPSSGTSAGRH